MKKGIGIALLSIMAFTGHAQSNFANVIPPSPAATAMQQYGNTNVSLYTGAVGISIPIHTIKLRDLEFSIGLNYSGSGGINVQQIASWVGTGWTLNATGAVSRTIYGLADDLPLYGYLSQDAIPQAEHDASGGFLNGEVFLDFANGRTDGQPDKYFYTANGVSGTFYIDKQKQVVQVPLTNNKIVPEFDGAKIIAFEVITDRGVIYRFDELEEVISYMPGGTSTDLTYQVSSWYLTSIQNHNKTDSINFHYEGHHTLQYSEAFATNVLEDPGIPVINATETNAKRLKFITYNGIGVIEFATGDIPRRDFNNEEFLASVKIEENDKRSSVDFNYSYFDQNGVVPITSTYVSTNPYLAGGLIVGQADGDHFKRLKLDAVNFFNDDRSESHPYTFEYYTETYLPSRFSYARDHWGFYNGQNGNPGLEPRRTIDRRPIISYLRGTDFIVVGKANREPSTAHAKAGMLTKITYPTGGWTEYEYELHQSSFKSLPNERKSLSAELSPLIPIDTIHLETSEPSIELTVSIKGIQLSEHCDIILNIRNLRTNVLTGLTDFNEVEGGSRTILMESGDYIMSYEAIDGVGTCFDDFYQIRFQWENEISLPNKNVGGLRIKRTVDYSGTGNYVNRLYSYISPSSGISSGSLGTMPHYGFYLPMDYQENSGIMQEYNRMYNTTTPLATTQGSHVGYNRVEVTTDEPNKTGKSVYFYTSPAEFPDFTHGWFMTKYDDQVEVLGSGLEFTKPYPLEDVRDWKRGILYAQEDYEYKDDQFVRIRRKENYYKIYAETNESFDSDWQRQYPIAAQMHIDEFFENDEGNGEGIPKLLGVRTECNGDCTGVYFKFYEYFSGRVELVSQVEKSYQDDQVLTSTTEYSYANSQYYYPTEIQISTSLEDHITTLLKYPFDHASLANLATSNKTGLESLVDRNVIANPVEKTIVRGSAEVERSRTNFIGSESFIWPDNVFASKSGSQLEQELDLIAYDSKGNLLEYISRDGIPTSIKYGYDDQFPVVKAINAHNDEIYYNSFEDSGTTGPSKTGKKYHVGDLTGTLSTANANSILSYWYWESDAWHYKQVPYSGGAYNITDGDRIDEVRIYPKGALITTYTYFPGIGVSSVTDQNSHTMYYEYDSFNRLTNVKDHDKNILQNTRYHIANTLTHEP